MRLTFQEEFPFHQHPIRAEIKRPYVPLTLFGPNGLSLSTYALVDSGSDTCLFSAKWAEKIGIAVKSGRLERTSGIEEGRTIPTYLHTIRIAVGASEPLVCPVSFSEKIGLEMSDNLLGRGVVFDRLRFAFRQGTGFFYVGSTP